MCEYVYETVEYKSSVNRPVPLWNLAPESWDNKIYSPASDVFMFGLFLWELFNDLNHRSPMDVYTEWGFGEFRDGLESGSSQERLAKQCQQQELQELILRCMSFNPAHRPTALEVKEALALHRDDDEESDDGG